MQGSEQDKKEQQTEQKEVDKQDTEKNKEVKTEQNNEKTAEEAEGEEKKLSKHQLKKLEKAKKHEEKQVAKEAKKAEEAKQVKDPKETKETKKKDKKELELTEEYVNEFNAQKLRLHKQKVVPGEGNNILITSALPYVNNVPHLGNIIGCVLSADVFARYKRLNGDNVLYICGTDQYGTATEVKALEDGKTPRQTCDHYFEIHDGIYRWFDIDFDYFGRTSTPWHTTITQEIFSNLKNNALMFIDKMTECFCEKCDRGLADRYVIGTCPSCKFERCKGDQCDKCQRLFNSPTELEDPKCHACKSKAIQRDTDHFFIDLTKIQLDLEKWIGESSKKGEWTENSIAVSKGWLNMGLKPKCITRNLKWGVPVPVEGF